MIFDRVVCGIDLSPESLASARQAARLVDAETQLVLVSVVDLDVVAQAGWAATTVAEDLKQEQARALELARREIAEVRRVDARLLEGPVRRSLLAEIDREQATLLCLGGHERSRAAGIVIGGIATALLHDAPCSVLLGRAARDPELFPASVVVGLDGSPQAAAAAAVAAALGARFGAPVRRVVAAGGKRVDPEQVRRANPDAEVVPGKPVDVLIAASEGADLVVVGSRGLHGVRAIGSVSERVAHQAKCSVLVVR